MHGGIWEMDIGMMSFPQCDLVKVYPPTEYPAKSSQRVAQTHYDVGWCDGVCLVNSGILLGEFLHTILPIS